MSVRIQVPATSLLVDAIASCAKDSLGGGAVFAFATREGVSRFFRIPAVNSMLTSGHPFTLIVGTDAITNAQAILEIEKVAATFPNLRALAHVHESAVTFHPKFCWFDHQQSRLLIVGSGNLTSRGLGGGSDQRLGNWEAFLQQEVIGGDRDALTRQIEEWIALAVEAQNLLPLDDDRVRDAAVANSQVSYVSPKKYRKRTQIKKTAPQAAVLEVPNEQISIWLEPNRVLIREIPLNRTGQADLTKAGLAFFGFSDAPVKILVQHVGENGDIGQANERNLFSNLSQNYRIELPEAAAYTAIGPGDQRTVLVAVKFDEGAYRYTLIPITSENYQHLDAYLGAIPEGRRYMRMEQTSFTRLREIWVNAPDALFPILAMSADSAG